VRDPVARAYFFDEEGKPRPVGYLLKNPELARTLREIADGGADAFYRAASPAISRPRWLAIRPIRAS
jgi:gamma-glutamyltranspeptidase